MDNNNQNRNNGKKPGGPGIWGMVIVLCITLAVVSMMNSALKKSQSQEVSYDEFVRMIEDGEVEAVRESGSRLVIVPKSSSTQYSRLIQYYTVRVQDLKLTDRLLESGVRFEGEDTSASSSIINFIVGWVLPSVLMIGLLYMMFSRMGGGSGIMGVGKSNAKVYVQKETGVTFADVAGEDEAKESLVEIVDFLHNPQKYTKIGAKLPKERVRRCLPRRWLEKPRCRFIPCPVRTLWKCSWAWERPVSGTCSSRPSSRLPVSSLLTRSTPSDGAVIPGLAGTTRESRP